jgi:hypothetical protein
MGRCGSPLPEMVAHGGRQRLAMWVAVRDGCHSSVVAWASMTAASSVEDAMCITGRCGRCLQRGVGWRAGGSLCGRECLGVRRRAQQRVKWRAGGLVAVAVGGGLQPLGLVEVSLDENPIPFLEGRPRRSDVMFSL